MNFSAFYQSFYSRDFYRTNATQGRGIGFWFLGLVSLVMICLFLITARSGINHFFDSTMPSIIDKMPTMTIENGQISLDRPWPYSVPLGTLEEGGDPLQISFEDREFKDLNSIMGYMQENHILALVTPTNIMLLSPENQEFRAFTIDNTPTREVITPQDMHTMAATAKHWFWPVAVIVGTIIMQLCLLIFALALSLAGLIINLLLGAKLPYATVLRFSSYAIWPTLLILTALGFFGVVVGGKLLMFGIAVLFLIFGIASTRFPTLQKLS